WLPMGGLSPPRLLRSSASPAVLGPLLVTGGLSLAIHHILRRTHSVQRWCLPSSSSGLRPCGGRSPPDRGRSARDGGDRRGRKATTAADLLDDPGDRALGGVVHADQ